MSNEDQKPEATPAPLPSGENGGFCSVAHPIFRHWMAILSGDAFQALCCVIDRTWGFQRQVEYISLSDFKRAMGVPAKHDETVYRALRELFFFKVIAESETKGKRGVKAYFVTQAAMNTTNTVLVVESGRLCITTNRGLVDLLTLREEIHSHHVSSSPNRTLVDVNRLFTRQAAHQEARAKARQRAKDTSLKKDFKHTAKERAASLDATPPAVNIKNEKEEKKDERTNPTPPEPSGETMGSKSKKPTEKELPARRLAARLAKEQQETHNRERAEQDAKDREVSRLQQAYDEAVCAKSQAAPNSPEWEAARQRLNKIKRQLGEHGWYL